MKFPRLTASRLQLAADCPGSHSLPWVASRSKAAEDGTAGHAFLARIIAGDADGARAALPEEMRARCEAIDLVALLGDDDPRAEVAFAWDPRTDKAREIGENIGRDYSAASGDEIVGTADFVRRDSIADFKFGAGFVTHPRENWQFKFLALANARVRGDMEATAQLVKIDEDGKVLLVGALFDGMDLDAIAGELRRIHERVLASRMMVEHGQTPELVTGDQCHYCPAFSNCPAQAGAGQALVALSDRVATLTPERAGEAWVVLRTVEQACEKVRDVLRTMAEAEPLPLPNGKRLAPVAQHFESLDFEVALQAAADAEGVDVREVVGAATVTKAALVKALGKEGAARLIDRMRTLQGVRESVRMQLREVR